MGMKIGKEKIKVSQNLFLKTPCSPTVLNPLSKNALQIF